MTIPTIYCHWDGYVNHNGMILKEHYDKVQELIALGGLSSLESKIKLDNNNSQEEVCVA